MRRFSTAATLFGLALACAVPAAAGELTVYTALEADQLKAYKEAFEAANPGTTINWVRDSTGIVTAKLLAEKDNPQADAVLGLAATSLMLLDKEGMLMGYEPKGIEALTATYRDPANPPKWVGMDVWSSALCFNTVEGEKKGLKKPESWADLIKPEYAGQITMPNPASSGTGYLMVSAWLQIDGRGEGLGLYGRASQQYRGLYAFRLQALQAGGGRRIHDGPFLRVPRQQEQAGRRAARCRAAVGRRGLGHGSSARSLPRPRMPMMPRS